MLLSLGCHGTVGAAPTDAAADQTTPCSGAVPPTDDHALDLCALAHGVGGVNDNVAFPIDLRSPVKKITALAPDQIVEVYDRVGCWQGVEPNLSSSIGAAVGPGQAATVTRIDVAFIPDPQGLQTAGGLCYGYRSLDGTWHWSLAVVKPVHDAATSRDWVTLPVTGGPMDALAIVFEDVYHLEIGAIGFSTTP